MRTLAGLVAITVLNSSADAAEKPLPSGIQVMTAEQVSKCEFVDVVSAMRFAMTSASKTSRAALIAALEKAKEKGANAAVITGNSVDHNQHQFTLSAYRCKLSAERG